MKKKQRQAAYDLRHDLLETLYGLHGWELEAQRLARLIRALDVALGESGHVNLARRYARILSIHRDRKSKRAA